ncbi:MAG TPA: hypothetical protein GX700_15550 [Paracoccus sp.]|nr:hypothetical protein [Paracoccus sp. (in: a-proteobacteria)]
MGGFLKGMAVGLASFALGFVVLAVVLEPQLPPQSPAGPSLRVPEAEVPLLAGEGEDAAQPEPGLETGAVALSDAPVSDPVAEGHDAVNEGVGQALDAVAPERGDPLDADAPSEADVPAAVGGEEMVWDEQGAEAGATREPRAPLEDDLSGAEVAAEARPAPEAEPEPDGGIGSPGTGGEPDGHTPRAAPAPSVPDEIAPAPRDRFQPADEPATERAEPGDDGAGLPGAPAVLRAVPPSAGLDRVVEGVTTGRLPSIAAETSEEVAENPEGPEGAREGDTPAAIGAETPPARERYAAPHDPAAGPLFAVVLLDMPADPAAEAAIIALPMPVGVVLDPHDPDAPRRARAYRAAGHEVVILATGLPRGATPSDLDVTFDAWFRALPEAVAVIDAAERGFQGNRALAQAIMPFLAADGHGLITHDRGLNPAQQSANSAGVANATVFRIIDGGDENQFTIRRYLDRATFRAQQEGHVVVMGRAAHPDTIDGLIGWRMEGRAGQVAMVPVSAVLRLP